VKKLYNNAIRNVLCFAKPQSLTETLWHTHRATTTTRATHMTISTFYPPPLTFPLCPLLLLLRQACRIYGIETRKSSVGVKSRTWAH